MSRRNVTAISAAAVAAFFASSAWYAAFGNLMMELRGTDAAAAASTGASPLGTMVFVVAQSLVVASMISYLASRLGIAGPLGAVRLGALLWIFPASILLGSVVHEGVPPMLAAIHAGDWLVKLILMAVVLRGLRRRRGEGSEGGGWRLPGRRSATVHEGGKG